MLLPNRYLRTCIIFSAVLDSLLAFAGDQPLSDKQLIVPAPVEVSFFSAGKSELELLGGSYSSRLFPDSRSPKIVATEGDFRFGLMLTNPLGASFYRGNIELLANLFGGGTTSGPSGNLTGGRLIVRYNFVQPKSWFVPYFQLDGGALYNDVFQNHQQTIIGGPFQFSLGAQTGVRLFFNDHAGLLIEGGYQHVSDAGLTRRNQGWNGLGGSCGFFLGL